MPTPTSRDEAIDELITRRALYELALRYARGADRRDYESFREIFCEQGAIHGHRDDPATSEPLYSMEGRETIVKGLSGLEQFVKTQHHVTNQLVQIEGDRAHGETYCTAHHIYLKDGEPWNLTMAIRYQDQWVREGGRWWYEERRLWVDWERHEPLGDGGWVD